MGVITFNGKTSTSYGIQVEHPPNYVIAEEVYETVPIPGRNGDLIYTNKKYYKNVPREYEISFYNGNDKMEKISNSIYEFLHTAKGYARLEDTYDTDVFRLAYYNRKLDLENILFYAGRGKIEFTCKPQRFLKSGETPIIVQKSAYDQGFTGINNSTLNDASPIIRIYGTGRFEIGSYLITIAAHGNIPYINIDCETMDAGTYGSTDCNKYVTFGSYDEIVLKPGVNEFVMGEGITEVRITPRWWIL